MEKEKPIYSFRNLDVYQGSYKASILVIKKIVPKLPESEKKDLADQLSRSCKAVPRLIAEGYGKKHQKAGFQKYLSDAMSEANETVVSLSHTRDLYLEKKEDVDLCDELIDIYDKSGRQLFKLNKSWESFNDIRKD